MKRRLPKNDAPIQIATLALLALCACAGDPLENISTPSETFRDEAAERAMGVKVSFRASDFFSLAHPLPAGNACAGDAKKLYHPYLQTNGTDAAFEEDPLNYEISYHPLFLKNVSVDLTDASIGDERNAAIQCSLSGSVSSPPPSECATFDSGVFGGLSADMGGSLLLAGGLSGANYSAYSNTSFAGPGLACGSVSSSHSNDCRSDVFALQLDALPASAGGSKAAPGAEGATEAISLFSPVLSSSDATTSFRSVAGASAAYNPRLKRAIIYGGSTSDGSASGFDSDLTQVYDVRTRKWGDQATPVVSIASALTIAKDTEYTSGTTMTISKTPGARSSFGYTAVPHSALQSVSTEGEIGTAFIDPTDRIVITGGQATSTSAMTHIYSFNPTFGPEIVDLSNDENDAPEASVASPGKVLQWAEAGPFRLLSDLGPLTGSAFSIAAHPSALAFNYPSSISVGTCTAGTGATLPYCTGDTPSRMMNFGIAPLLLNAASPFQGSFLLFSGFDFGADKIGSGYTGSNTMDRTNQGRLSAWVPRGNRFGVGNPFSTNIARFSGAPYTREGARLSPSHFTDLDTNEYWLGGLSLVQGFNKAANAATYFALGGSSCRGYGTSTTLTTTDVCFGANFTGVEYTVNATDDDLTLGSSGLLGFTALARAGMAVARGEDAAGNVIIVAFGGSNEVRRANIPSTSVHVIYAAPAPTLQPPIAATGTTAPAVTDGALVYSHVTKKFYLFGGIVFSTTNSSPSPNAETWELTISGTAGAYTTAWRQLTPSCYPSCPQARRSHRFLEVNYNNIAPNAEPDCSVASAPCSFGLFMEGGSPDSLELSLLGDRWMFDPTAQPGTSGSDPQGHWQRVDQMPPRRLASMTSFSYQLPFTGESVDRALLFGGETTLAQPQVGTGYFVAPTLGDTWLYDFAGNTWNRVKLLGQGVHTDWTGLSRFDQIQSYAIAGGGLTSTNATFSYEAPAILSSGTITGLANPNIAKFSPPALAGAVMVTRHYPSALTGNATENEALKIPEVFLIGGRKKDGSLQSLRDVWKFCTASPGERPATITSDAADNAECDAFDETNNSDSISPTAEYTGRWLYKNPEGSDGTNSWATYNGSATYAGSYLGAGTYDSVRDRIILHGGLVANASSDKVTQVSQLTTAQAVLEYTPPSRVVTAALDSTIPVINGAWTAVPTCTRADGSAPASRYAHSLAYDALNRQLVMSGGLRAETSSDGDQGDALTATLTLGDGNTVTLPEVWSGKRLDAVPDSTSKEYAALDDPTNETYPCYLWTAKTTYANSPDYSTLAPPVGGISHAAATFIPATGYRSGYYSMFDSACVNQGPVSSADSSISKLLAGGAYLDLDRDHLGENENLILHLTFIALGPDSLKPDGTTFPSDENARLKIHLMSTGRSLGSLQAAMQPRHLEYANLDQYPKIVDTLAVVAPPASGLRQEQIMIPVTTDASIDRIRIERYSGSAVLIDATLYRTQAAGGAE